MTFGSVLNGSMRGCSVFPLTRYVYVFYFFFLSARYHPVSFYPLHFLILFPLSALSPLHYPQRDGFFAKLSSLFRSFISELLSEGVREVTLPWQQRGCFLASILAASLVVVWVLCLYSSLRLIGVDVQSLILMAQLREISDTIYQVNELTRAEDGRRWLQFYHLPADALTDEVTLTCHNTSHSETP